MHKKFVVLKLYLDTFLEMMCKEAKEKRKEVYNWKINKSRLFIKLSTSLSCIYVLNLTPTRAVKSGRLLATIGYPVSLESTLWNIFLRQQI